MHIIRKYTFGQIQINKKSYNTDVIVFPKEVLPNWWRKEGHFLHLEDLIEVIKRKPEILIIGTGYYGAMIVPQEIVTHLEEEGINTIVKNSSEAVKDYNNFVKNNHRIAVALHLTC
jgi:hypothetical protein